MKFDYLNKKVAIFIPISLLLFEFFFSLFSYDELSSNALITNNGIQTRAIIETTSKMDISPIALWGMIGTLLLYAAFLLFFNRQRTSENLNQNLQNLIILFGILMLSLFVRTLILDLGFFMSDESFYVYSAYSVSRGNIPYKDIFAPHPPLMLLTYIMPLFFGITNHIMVRFINVIIFLATTLLFYYISKYIFKENKRLPLICSAIYSFYPSIFLLFSVRLLNENLLTFFTLFSIAAYFYSNSKSRFLLLSGVMLGGALMTTLRAVYFIIPFFLFQITTKIMRRQHKTLFREILIMLLGTTIPIMIVGFWILNLGVLNQFITQTIRFHAARFPMFSQERMFYITWYVSSMVPLLTFSIPGAIYSAKKAMRGNMNHLLPTFLYLFTFLVIMFVSPTSFLHYFVFLNPYLILICAHGVAWIKNIVTRKLTLILPLATFLIIFIAFIPLTMTQGYTLSAPLFKHSPFDDSHHYIGKYVATITDPDDKIWTSEGAIAFYAQRLIQSPNSKDFPFQPCFDYVFAYHMGEYMGDEMQDYPNGFLTIQQFIESWEQNKTKVIILLKFPKTTTYPDNLLWTGFQGQEGAASYISTNYNLHLEAINPDKPLCLYEIWLRKP